MWGSRWKSEPEIIYRDNPNNPNPNKFKINKVATITPTLLVVEIEYAGCTNFEGKKICVFNGFTEEVLRSLKSIDPHFDTNPLTPIARFKPNEEGWINACNFALNLGN